MTKMIYSLDCFRFNNVNTKLHCSDSLVFSQQVSYYWRVNFIFCGVKHWGSVALHCSSKIVSIIVVISLSMEKHADSTPSLNYHSLVKKQNSSRISRNYLISIPWEFSWIWAILSTFKFGANQLKSI